MDRAAEIPSGAAIDVDEGRQPDAEAAGVPEDQAMRGRDARGACVEIKARIEPRLLVLAAVLDDAVAAADGPDAAADPVARLEHGHTKARALQLVSGDQPGDARAENDHRAPAAARRRQAKILGAGGGRDREPHRLHREIGRARAANRPDSLQQTAPSECHAPSRSLSRQSDSNSRLNPTNFCKTVASPGGLKRSLSELNRKMQEHDHG